MMTRFSHAILLVAAVVGPAAVVIGGQHNVAKPAGRVFPIVCLLGPPAEENTVEHWQRAREANFTVAVPSYQYSDADQLKMLDYCQAVGLKGVVHVKHLAPPESSVSPPSNWPQLVQDAVDRYTRHPALYGYMVRDEPGATLFPQLGRVVTEFKKCDPRHPVCINLFPVHATEQQLQTPSYSAYLDQYLQTVAAPFLCYDHYPFLLNNKDRPDFFLNLELARDAGLRHKTPIWTVVLSGWGTLFRKPTPAELRWQVYGAMAYGIRGLVYFAYWPTNDRYTSVVDYYGHPQPIYDTMRQLNGNVLQIGKALRNARSTGVFHTGVSLPEGSTRLPDKGVSIHLPQEFPLIAGVFQHPSGQRSVLIVNRDYHKSVTAPVTFDDNVEDVETLVASSGARSTVVKPRCRDVLLPPGGAVLFSWKHDRRIQHR